MTVGRFPDDLTVVFLATGRHFSGCPHRRSARRRSGAPIVLTCPDALPETTRVYLLRLRGLRRLVILGGPAAISEAVERELTAVLDP